MQRRRPIISCTRCHKRKRKCDRAFPKCSNCKKAGVDCTGLNPSTNGDAPRSVVQFLEHSIAQVEIELASAAINQKNPSIDLLRILEDDILARSAAVAHPRTSHGVSVASTAYKHAVEMARMCGIASATSVMNDFRGIPYRSTILLNSELPLPLSNYQSQNLLPTSHLNGKESTKLPFTVAKRLYGVYVEKILPQNPFFLEDDLWEHFRMVYSESGSSSTDISTFMVYMVLAISTMTSKADDFYKIVSLSESLHRDALRHCNFLSSPGIRSLQGILLLVQFAELLPYTGNLWHLVSEAVSLATELGLHQDPHDVEGLDFVSIDLRRRMFWTVYCMERSITVTSHRPFTLKDEHINVEFPSEYEDSFIRPDGVLMGGRRTKFQFLNYIRFRQIQSEILAVQFFNRSVPGKTYIAWMSDMERRLTEWQQRALSQTEIAPDWFYHAVWQCHLMLHRPCPRNSNPSEQSMRSCFEAAIGLSRGSWELLQTGYLQYPFHNAHNGFEAATVVLYSLRHHTKMIRERYGNKKVVELIHQLSGLFTVLSERWPAAATISDFYDDLKKTIMKEFLSVFDSSVLPCAIYHVDQLDFIVLHRPVANIHNARSSQTRRLEITGTEQPEAESSTMVSEDWRPTSQIDSAVLSFPNSQTVDCMAFEADTTWIHMDTFNAPNNEIERYLGGKTSQVNHMMPSSLQNKELDAINSKLDTLRKSPNILPRCNQCRARRMKCERVVLECQRCMQSGGVCEYYDELSSQNIPSSYINALQQKLQGLLGDQKNLQSSSASFSSSRTEDSSLMPANAAHVLVRTTTLDLNSVQQTSNQDRKLDNVHMNTTFFGYSSAISQLAGLKDQTATLHRGPQTFSNSTYNGLTSLSNMALRQGVELPPQSTAIMLVGVFSNSINTLYHIISEQDLRQMCSNAYNGTRSNNSLEELTLYLIFAISLQLLSRADSSLSISSMAYFREVVGDRERLNVLLKRFRLESVRVALLICLYVLLCPQSGDIWRLVGFASRICLEMANVARNDKREQETYCLLYQTLHCIDCNVAIAFGRPPQLSETFDSIYKYTPKLNPDALAAERLAPYYHAIRRIKSRLHDTLMTKYVDRYSSLQAIKKCISNCRERLEGWSLAWNAEVDQHTTSTAHNDLNGNVSKLKLWGDLAYYETILLIHRFSASDIPVAERLFFIQSFLQCCSDLFYSASNSASRVLSDPFPSSAIYLHPTTWTTAHSALSAALELVKLKELSIDGSQEAIFRRCITLLALLEGDRNNLLEGLTQTLERLYTSDHK